MSAAAVVTLIAVVLTVVALAAFLIIVALILQKVSSQLNVILTAVQEVTEKSEPVGAVIDDINASLDSSHKALAACVERLEARAASDAVAQQPARRSLT